MITSFALALAAIVVWASERRRAHASRAWRSLALVGLVLSWLAAVDVHGIEIGTTAFVVVVGVVGVVANLLADAAPRAAIGVTILAVVAAAAGFAP